MRMGKVKEKMIKKIRGDGPSPNTLFVSNLPYSFTNSQLEEVFSDVGPIRRCFLVAPKGSNENLGFGFVQFALKDDADRAIELKNNYSIEGRLISVKRALHRTPLDQRRPNKTKGLSADSGDNIISSIKDYTETKKKNGVSREHRRTKKPIQAIGDANGEDTFSSKQKVARTVIFGCMLSDEIAKEVHRKTMEIGSVCSYSYPLPDEVLEQYGLEQEGCKPKASAALYASVKEARLCVRTLHRKEINGCIIWARQLGGEGSKTQKWKLIIRNLPFKVKSDELKDLFSGAGFVWDVLIPRDSATGNSKGFAFVRFTSKVDAEKAIQKLNKHMFGKRPIAVDWAIPKQVYSSICNESVSPETGHKDDLASEDDNSDSDIEAKPPKDSEHSPVKECANSSENQVPSEVDFAKEAEMTRKVLKNFYNQVPLEDLPPIENNEDKIGKSDADGEVGHVNQSKDVASGVKSNNASSLIKENDDDLNRTVFISNLPFDVETNEMKQKFSVFGDVLAFHPVLHQITKRQRGTGFLKFKSAESAAQAVLAANAASGLGIFLKGRQLKVMKALDKKSANDKVLEKTKNGNQDHRNLSLAKEGCIVEGTPASFGVSASDMAKRKRLMEKKMQKLKSPNFHVSKTRLIVYNIPSNVTEEELKKIFLNAVTSRATKQRPVIRQMKFLRSMKNGKVVSKDRVVAFVEFSEHQHALVALRVLNNNPEIFGAERRPIIDFALDNVQTLKLRNEKMKGEQDKRNADMDDQKSNKRVFKSENKFRNQRNEGSESKFNNKRRKDESSESKFDNKRRRIESSESKFDDKVGKVKGSKSKFDDKRRKVKGSESKFINKKKRKVERDDRTKDKGVVDHLDQLVEHYRAKFSKSN